jgi:hypothetical protein
MATGKPTPLNAPKRRVRGSTKELRRAVWACILELEELLSSEDPDTKIKCAHAMASLARAYLAVVESTDLEERLSALEARIADIDHTGRRYG